MNIPEILSVKHSKLTTLYITQTEPTLLQLRQDLQICRVFLVSYYYHEQSQFCIIKASSSLTFTTVNPILMPPPLLQAAQNKSSSGRNHNVPQSHQSMPWNLKTFNKDPLAPLAMSPWKEMSLTALSEQ